MARGAKSSRDEGMIDGVAGLRASLFRSCARGAALAAALVLAGCGSGSDERETYVERPVEDLYNTALDDLAEGRFQEARLGFEEVDRQHPYSVWATKAQLMAAFAAYQQGDYDEAIVALDRFIELHPGNRDTAYAYYLKALSYYEQITDVSRDQRITQLALQALQDVVTRFPGTDYARDAALKIDLARDHLAGKEMEIGRFYLRRGQYTAAINRFRTVVEQYQTTSHVPEALHRIAEAYQALGLTREAQQVAAVLGYNYPGSVWYIDSYELVEGVDVPGNEDAHAGLTGISWLDDLF
jgi:outer membrane protein assembly factor BamD